MPGLAPAAPGFFATRFEQRIRAFLNVCLSPRGVEFIFIAPDTYPKKLIGHAARTSAMRCSNVQAVPVRVWAGSTRVHCGCRDAFAQEENDVA
jgi:hypothetical protein